MPHAPLSPTGLVALAWLTVTTAQAAGPSLDLPSLTEKQVASFSALEEQAQEAVAAKKWETAARATQRALRLNPDHDGLWYNLACVQALLGRPAPALESLREALRSGWADSSWPSQDTDLTSLRELPEFRQWLTDVEATAEARAASVPARPADLATSAAEVDEQARAAEAQVQAIAEALGAAQRQRATEAITRWKVASFDAIGAAASTDAEREAAAWSALESLLRKDLAPRSPAFARDVATRADAFARAHRGSAHASSARFAAATGRVMKATDEGGEPSETAREAFERELLLIAATAPDGPGLERALARLVALENDDIDAARGFHERLRRVMGDEQRFRALMTSEARGAHYRIAGLPEFRATTLDGRDVTPADLEGRVTLLDFWATWCGPCRAELPHVKEAYARFKDKGFEIVGISLDRAKDGDATAFRAWCAENGVTWPQVFDGKHWEAELAKTFGVRSIPFPLLVGRDGSVRGADEDLRGESLIAAIEAAIEAEN